MHREYRDASRRLEALPADTLLAFARRDTMIAKPGERYSYSNTGYMILGALIEKLYGTTYGAAVETEIARPLGLSTLGWCNEPRIASRARGGYERSAAGTLGLAVEINPALALGAGGLCGTALDITKWNLALHDGRVVSRESYDAMTNPRGAAQQGAYGFGLTRQRTDFGSTAIGHTGSQPGFAAQTLFLPGDSLSVTLLTNSSPVQGKGTIGPLLVRIALGIPLP
jgi:CubicO group peptidase (beta-lactamase class C family)